MNTTESVENAKINGNGRQPGQPRGVILTHEQVGLLETYGSVRVAYDIHQQPYRGFTEFFCKPETGKWYQKRDDEVWPLTVTPPGAVGEVLVPFDLKCERYPDLRRVKLAALAVELKDHSGPATWVMYATFERA